MNTTTSMPIASMLVRGLRGASVYFTWSSGPVRPAIRWQVPTGGCPHHTGPLSCAGISAVLAADTACRDQAVAEGLGGNRVIER